MIGHGMNRTEIKLTDEQHAQLNEVARRKGHPKAIGALARHLAEATYWILSKQEPYREPKPSAVSSTRDKRA